jgi:hypothetical protein
MGARSRALGQFAMARDEAGVQITLDNPDRIAQSAQIPYPPLWTVPDDVTYHEASLHESARHQHEPLASDDIADGRLNPIVGGRGE